MGDIVDVPTAPCANPVAKLITTPYFLPVSMSRQRLIDGLPLLEALPWGPNIEIKDLMYNWDPWQDL